MLCKNYKRNIKNALNPLEIALILQFTKMLHMLYLLDIFPHKKLT